MKGAVGFDQQVDLAARLTLKGGVGKDLEKWVADGAIPLRIRRTLKKPSVVPDLSVKDFLKNPLDRLKDLLGR
jgi:hypothetical protein